MELDRLIEALANPVAYPYPVDRVEVRHTHISVVFLAGPFVYKIRKPVNLGFLDFSTLAKRRHDCEEEVRLNRRLAPSVYLGVVVVAQVGEGVQLEGTGEALEWAVKMERLPPENSLRERLRHGTLDRETVAALARKVAWFHQHAEAGPHIAQFGRWEVVAGNARENFAQAQPQVGTTIHPHVFARLQERTEHSLAQLASLIADRAARGVPRDTHGDLHLDHVYLFPGRVGEEKVRAVLVIIDCIEFNERFRFADPVADMAFLVMDLVFHGRRDLARTFTEAYFQAAGDREGRALLPFYTSYRAAVRGKVEGFEFAEKEIPEAERSAALEKARAHWLLALGELEEPGRRPCLVLIGGLPGTGKSTLARGLAREAAFQVIRTDVVRKELQGPAVSPVFGEGMYTPAASSHVYAECLRRAESLLFEGKRVLIDASFGKEEHRQLFLAAARRWGVPAVLLLCEAQPELVRRRLDERRHDASDADWAVHQQARARWEPPTEQTRTLLHALATGGTTEQSLEGALEALRSLGLVEG